ncbi:MAG: hypothetical protein K1X55_17485 [Chitinophagales bacterium]|nr:hypothetical protein [Chitinophagales bacterium]
MASIFEIAGSTVRSFTIRPNAHRPINPEEDFISIPCADTSVEWKEDINPTAGTKSGRLTYTNTKTGKVVYDRFFADDAATHYVGFGTLDDLRNHITNLVQNA